LSDKSFRSRITSALALTPRGVFTSLPSLGLLASSFRATLPADP